MGSHSGDNSVLLVRTVATPVARLHTHHCMTCSCCLGCSDMVANAKYRVRCLHTWLLLTYQRLLYPHTLRVVVAAQRAMIAMLKDKRFGGVQRRRRKKPSKAPLTAAAAVLAAARGAGFMDNQRSGGLFLQQEAGRLEAGEQDHAPPPPPPDHNGSSPGDYAAVQRDDGHQHQYQ